MYTGTLTLIAKYLDESERKFLDPFIGEIEEPLEAIEFAKSNTKGKQRKVTIENTLPLVEHYLDTDKKRVRKIFNLDNIKKT